VQALLDATGDQYRLVRTRAAAGLAGYPVDPPTGEIRTKVEQPTTTWATTFSAGGELNEVVASYEAA